MPLIVQRSKQKDPSFSLITIKNQMQVAAKNEATLKETQVAMAKMYQNGTTKKLSLLAKKAAEVLAQYVYDRKATKKFGFVLGQDHQGQQLLLLTIVDIQVETNTPASLKRTIKQPAIVPQGQSGLSLASRLSWVTNVLQKVEFAILFWIHQDRLSTQEALVGTGLVPPLLKAGDFQRVKTAQELRQDRAWAKIIEVVQSLIAQQLGIKVKAQQLPSQAKITPQHLVLVIRNLITSGDAPSKVAKKLINVANIKVQPVDETGAIIITISKYGNTKLIAIFGFKATGTPQALAQAKINYARYGVVPPTRLEQVWQGQAPREGDVNAPMKEGVVFKFQVATIVSDSGNSTFTYEVDASPQVKGTTTKQVSFVVGGFETHVQEDVRLVQGVVQNLKVGDFRVGIDKTQMASGGRPSRTHVVRDIRNKIRGPNGQALISPDDITITFDNAAKTITITINNHGPTKTITIPGFKSITDYLDQLLDTVPPTGGTFVIPEGITSKQFDGYVKAMGDVILTKDKIHIVKSAENFANKYQTRITSLTVPNSFTTIDDWFQHFNKITSLTLGANLQTIGNHAFLSAQLTSLTIPDLVITIGIQAFELSTLTSLDLGTSLQTIANYAFENAQLESLIIPDSVTSIGFKAFHNSPLATIVIFDDVTFNKSTFKASTNIIKKSRPSRPSS